MINSSITSKDVAGVQKASFAQLISDAARQAAEVVVDELLTDCLLNHDNFQAILNHGDKIATQVTAKTKEVVADMTEGITGCLTLVSGSEILELDPTDGQATIAESKGVFNWVNPLSRDYRCNVPGKPTGKTRVAVYRMVRKGDFRRMFCRLGVDLGKLRFKQDQIIQFVQKHRQWLQTEGCTTFFLFGKEYEPFVAEIIVRRDDTLDANVSWFSNSTVFSADNRIRVVVPQHLEV